MTNRGKKPTDRTIRMLVGHAGGICQYEGCGKRMFFENVSLTKFNNAYIAHIVASSPDGPRGDDLQSYQLSDKLDNLMLMCADHHNLIDGDCEKYTVDVLKDMKRKHEIKMEEISKQFTFRYTDVIGFSSRIRDQYVTFDYDLATKAIAGNMKVKNGTSMTIDVSSSFNHHSDEYWYDCLRQLISQVERKIFSQIEQKTTSHISIFPLAPIPLIIKLGELIGDKVECDVFQLSREPKSWCWKNSLEVEFKIERIVDQTKVSSIAIIIALSSDISIDRIPGEYSIIYKIYTDNMTVDCIESKESLRNFWKCYQKVCDEIINKYGKEVDVGLFPAIPVSAAFEIGRRYMRGVYPIITIYDYNDGFEKTIKLGEEDGK